MTALATAPAVEVRPGPAKKRRRLRWQRSVSPVAILLLWEALSRGGVLSPEKLPAPSTVLATGWRLTADGTLGAHLLDSLTRAGIGLVIGGVLALVLGATGGLLRLGDDAIDPPVQMARMLPHLALVPLLIIWVGIGESMKITLVALGVFFPLYFNTYAGIRDIDERLVEAARTCGLGTWARLRHVILPGALPSLFLGLWLAIGAAWLSLVVGEQTNTQNGIGFLMMEAALGLLSDLLLRAVERRALAWRRGLRAS